MCGIAGFIDFKNPIDKLSPVYKEMLQSMTHRGPDDEGMFHSENVILMHKRLSVIDPCSSRQPMSRTINNERYTIVYNGELYNTEEIKNDLAQAGYSFETKGDTEVILLSYIHYGKDCVNHFNGIFAFAIWQENAQILFVARDAMGVKPLFYSMGDGYFIFASAVPTLLLHPKIKSNIDITSIKEIILLGPGLTPGCGVFSQIKSLPPAHAVTFSDKGCVIEEYFRLTDSSHPHSFEETVKNVNYLVTDAIKRQLVSDVPIGTFLSGGLDSSIISAVAADKMKTEGKTLETFSVTYKNHARYFKASHFQPDSDEKYIELMVKEIGSNHHEVVLETDDIISSLYEVIDEKGLPAMADVDSSLLAFCKEIRKHVTVALSGECADEIFGGYPWYRDKDIREKKGFPWAQNTLYRMEFVSDSLKEKIFPSYVSEKYNKALENVSLQQGLSPTEKRMREMFVLNTYHFMQTLLTRKDTCSMYASLEVRVPFCDRRIAQYLYCVPWEMKNYKDREKGLLRQAFQGVLPEEVLWRKKSPYPKTHNPEYLSALREIFSGIISDNSSPLWNIVNITKAKTLLAEEQSIPWYGQLMTTPQTIAYFIQLDYWMRKFNVNII